ncbi:MAG: glycosyltransferase [Bacteroidota bacterium]
MINITIVLPTLHPGGAERVLTFVADNLSQERFSTTVVIIGKQEEASYTIERARVIFFEKPRVLSGIRSLYKYIKKNRPDIVLSAVGHLNTVTAYMSLLFPKTKFVAREVNVLSVLAQYSSVKASGFMSYLSKKRFNKFDKIICQSQDMLNDLNTSYRIRQDKLVVINNPITDGFSLKTKTEKSNPIRFITVARLVKQKGHARIVEALGKLNFPFHYTMLGTGPEEEELFTRMEELGLKDSVTNIPFTKEVNKYLAESDIYLQGSYVEGFPNAIIESCMVGTPIIAFNAPGGINEIIETGVNGYIAEDESEYIKYINHLNTNGIPKPRDVSYSVTKKYHKDIIIKKYEDLFLQLVNPS